MKLVKNTFEEEGVLKELVEILNNFSIYVGQYVHLKGEKMQASKYELRSDDKISELIGDFMGELVKLKTLSNLAEFTTLPDKMFAEEKLTFEGLPNISDEEIVTLNFLRAFNHEQYKKYYEYLELKESNRLKDMDKELNDIL